MIPEPPYYPKCIYCGEQHATGIICSAMFLHHAQVVTPTKPTPTLPEPDDKPSGDTARMSDIRDLARGMARTALHEGGKLALDSAIRVIGRLVQTFTVNGNVREAAGASAAMEMLKRLRDHTPELYEAHEREGDNHE